MNTVENKKNYLAHISEDGRKQTLEEHLNRTAELAANFCSIFDARSYGYAAGLIHDIGKFEEKFQARLYGSNIRFEHSSAGAYELSKLNTKAAYILSHCVAGHHSGLPDTGFIIDNIDMPTLYGKINREKKSSNDYLVYKCLFNINDISPNTFPDFDINHKDAYTASFFIRMIFSALVDADFLDTENFMKNNTVIRLHGKKIECLNKQFENYMMKFAEPKTDINRLRNQLFNICVKSAEDERGLFRLTIPTGGGKTLTSMGFALKHAMKNNMRRIIYVIPYTSIIAQTVNIFRDIFGLSNVLGHYSTANYDDDKEEMSLLRLASENWDIPIIVTTNVQFFESLYAAKPSKCRKLHNIVNSVIIFDETQMLPNDYLLPCLRAITELCFNYKCSAVLCTATQPAVSRLLPPKVAVKDIYPDYKSLFTSLKRCVYKDEGKLENANISEKLLNEDRVLCIVNAKKTAKEIYESIKGEDAYHLSTYMYPAHIISILNRIKILLRKTHKRKCRLISTSLIEAGVDISFPTVYREYAGIDSIIQAGGRCNRENEAVYNNSIVHMFESEKMTKRLMPSIKQTIEAALDVIRQFEDISSPEAITSYFNRLYKIKGKDDLDKKEILSKLFYSANFYFKTAAENFKLIDNDTTAVFIPREKKAIEIYKNIKEGKISKTLLREIGLYSVNLYENEFIALKNTGCLDFTESLPDMAVVVDLKYYSDETGIMIPNSSSALII